MNDELKSCPFCGGKAELVYLDRQHRECFVKCLKCKVEQGHVYMSKKTAITAWNRRAKNEQRHGNWIEAKYPLFTCSECGATYQDNGYGYNYCPNCGADMRGEANDQTTDRQPITAIC